MSVLSNVSPRYVGSEQKGRVSLLWLTFRSLLASLLLRWKTANTAFVILSFNFQVWRYTPTVAISLLRDLGAGVEQPFDCLIVQNGQAMQSMGRSMDWSLEDNMVDGLYLCATRTGRRSVHTPFVQAGAETSSTGLEAGPTVRRPDPRCSWKGNSRGGGCRCRGWKCGVLQGCTCPTIPHSISDPPSVPHVCYYCSRNDELLCGEDKWVFQFETPCICTRWTWALSGLWSRCPYFMTQRARDSVAPLRRISACLWGCKRCRCWREGVSVRIPVGRQCWGVVTYSVCR